MVENEKAGFGPREGRPGRFVEVRHVATTGSTNADLLAEATQAPSGTVLVADHQTAGRGRQSRTWLSQPGNALLVSVLLRPPSSIAPLLTLIAGLAAVDTVDDLLGVHGLGPSDDRGVADGHIQSPVGLKWPNDVLAAELGERKLAGILAEAVSVDGGMAVVLGMGLNLRWGDLPEPVVGTAVALDEVAASIGSSSWPPVPVPNSADSHLAARDFALERFLIALDSRLADAEERGPKAVLAAYRARCLTLGRAVRFETAAEVIAGRAVAVADDGALVVESDGRRVTLRAGDAHHVSGHG